MLQCVLIPVRDCAWSYVDDLAVFSNEWDDHLKHLDRTLHCISDCGLTLTLAKSDFAQPEFMFCGQIVGSGHRRVDPDKLSAIMQLKRPETKTQVRQVLGLFGWFREFIPNYA